MHVTSIPETPAKKKSGWLLAIIIVAAIVIVGHFVDPNSESKVVSVCTTSTTSSDKEVQVSCPVLATDFAGFDVMGTLERIAVELKHLQKHGLFEQASRVTIWFWVDGAQTKITDKYGNIDKSHIQLFTIGWRCDDLRLVNWDQLDVTDISMQDRLFLLSDGASMAYNNLGEEALDKLKNFTTK
jgi:hypothetical protein